MTRFLSIRAESAPWYAGIQLLLMYQIPQVANYAGVFREPHATGEEGITRVDFEQMKMGERVDSTFSLQYDQAQLLMDDLWHCGLRPSEGTGSAGQLRATEKHLEDMREQNRQLLDKVLE